MPPYLTHTPTELLLSLVDNQPRIFNFIIPLAHDRVDRDVDVVCDPAPGTLFASGETIVTCTATDDSGNSSDVAFTVFAGLNPGDPIEPEITPVIPEMYFNTFDSSLDSWTYHQAPIYSQSLRYCGTVYDNVYVLSHSTENGGSAYTSNTTPCWFGSAGGIKSFDFPANHNTLNISLDYRGLTAFVSAHVNNLHLMVTDSSDTVLHTSNIFVGDRGARLPDTGWRDFEVSTPIDTSQCPCNVFVYLTDHWLSQWHQRFYMDNVVLTTSNTSTQLDGLPTNISPNSLKGNDYLNMHASNSTVINEVNLFSDAIKYSWNEMPDTDYKVMISSTNSESFTDYASETSYTFVDLEHDTLYTIAVAPRDDDTKQSQLSFTTLTADQISYNSTAP